MFPQLLKTLCKFKALALTSAPLLLFLPVSWSHALLRDSPVMINATSGGQCVLPFPCPVNSTLLVLQWSRPDLKAEGYVFDLRPHYLHPSYRGRVHLKDPHHNSCDVVLKNVTSNDTGVYKSWALHRGPGSTAELTSHHVIQLRVKDLPGGDNRDQRVEEQLPKQRSRYGVLLSLGFMITLLCLYTTSKLCQRCRIPSSSSEFSPTKPPDPSNPLSPETTVLNS